VAVSASVRLLAADIVWPTGATLYWTGAVGLLLVIAAAWLFFRRRRRSGSDLLDRARSGAAAQEGCLARASQILREPNPSPRRLEEAQQLLQIVLDQAPQRRPLVDYWRAVAFTHARDFERVAEALEDVLDPHRYPPGDPDRRSILFDAWQVALSSNGEQLQRIGLPQLGLPGRRMEAIACVEATLRGDPSHHSAWNMKRLLYGDLTEADYIATSGEAGAVAGFDHAYAEQLGQALLSQPDRRSRAFEFLRLAARGQPLKAPAIFWQLAQVCLQNGDHSAAQQYAELAKRAGKSAGANVPAAEMKSYLDAVKFLAETARTRGDLDAAIANYTLYAESERGGIETARILASLYEEKGDALGALRATEWGLIYDANDVDFRERKERCYYSVTPADLRQRRDWIGQAFDVEYCLKKAAWLLNFPGAGPDLVQWAGHLAELVEVAAPGNLRGRLLHARVLRRAGDVQAARQKLGAIYAARPAASSSDEEDWFACCRILGEMYLYELDQPQAAVKCLSDYRQSSKSGADTIYKLGQAYEQLGDRKRAANCYKQVTAYEGHPLRSDAYEALERVGG
jgi:LPXTG-motif cell wall-anchored protein